MNLRQVREFESVSEGRRTASITSPILTQGAIHAFFPVKTMESLSYMITSRITSPIFRDVIDHVADRLGV